MSEQLTLALNLQADAVFANFYPGEQNQQLLMTLQEVARGRGEQFVYLWGAEGSGRTHLLQACCHVADHFKLAPIYLSFAELDQLDPSLLEGLEALPLVCIDDVQGIAGRPAWEEAFFHFFNRMREAGRRLIVAGKMPPAQLGMALPDLISRLSWGVAFHLKSLNDEEKLQALLLRAKARGLYVPDNVAQYLIKHWPRDMRSLFDALDKLDHASLVAKRKLTIPFVKEVLAL